MIQRDLTIEKEPLTPRLAAELMFIAEMHKNAVLPYDDIPLEPDLDMMYKMSEIGLLHIFTARMAGELVGYLIAMTAPLLFSKGVMVATQEALYVRQDRRKGMLCSQLIRTADDWLKDAGIVLVMQRVHKDVDYSPLLKRLGYTYTDSTYTRRL